MDEVLLNIYEKDQVKNLTKVAMAGDKTEFNDEAFDREYSQFATLNRYRQQGRPLPQKLPPLAPHDLRASSQLIRRAADETASYCCGSKEKEKIFASMEVLLKKK